MRVPFNEVDKGSLTVVEYNEKHDCISAQTQLRAKTPPTQLFQGFLNPITRTGFQMEPRMEPAVIVWLAVSPANSSVAYQQQLVGLLIAIDYYFI